ncbi:MAG: hypothetical protein ACW98U_09030 [Candidatus Thorarchaeota archaeon]|jgi:hypothetical protein
MQQRRSLGVGDYSLVIITLGVIIVSLVPLSSGFAFIEMVSEHMALILFVLVSIAAMMAGIIFTYALAQFTLQKQFRHLVLIFFAVNMIIITIFYFLTNVSMMSISPFSNRARNRTIVAAFAFVLAPSILFTGVSDTIDLTRKRMVIAILWGGLLSPLISIWFMFSQDPVFLTTLPGGGLTVASYLILALILPVWIVAGWRYYSAWKLERNRLDLAALLSILLWAYAICLFVIQSDPLQILEIIWYCVFLAGELLLAVVTVTTQIIGPQKELSILVEMRTEELLESKKEIEFYLNIWGHKIGNLLQSMVLYLEMFSSGGKGVDELSKMADTALLIGTEANQINRQVAALIKLKEQEEYEMTSVNLREVFETTLHHIQGTYGSQCVQKTSSISEDVYIFGDEFIELALMNLFSFICKDNPDSNILFTPTIDSESVTLEFIFHGPRLPRDIEESLFSRLEPARTTLSLDLFTVKILMQRFQGFFRYEWEEESEQNKFVLRFKRLVAPEKDIIPTQEHSTTTNQ